MVIKGFLTSGRCIGANMVTANQDVIEEKLNGSPFPGTLNIVLDEPLLLKKAHQLDTKGKQFGVNGLIGGIPCILYRFNYAPMHVLEVISTVHLRNTLGLIDGQEIEISVSEENIKHPSNIRRRIWELFYKGRLEAYYQDNVLELFMAKGVKFFHKKACQSKKEFV